jgi:tRNA modification GTPase
MFSPDDTIVALATPPGRGGLAVVRLSGPLASSIALTLIEGGAPLEPRRATLVRVVAGGQAPASHPDHPTTIDEAIVTFFAAPASYTGDDVVEFSLHGSPVIAGEVIAAAVAAGARLAGPGEFTLRAFLNGRIDLTRAEAVRDLVEATTPLQARMAFDQLQGALAERLGEIERRLFDLMARLEASGDFPDEGYHFITPEETLDAIRSALARMDALLADSRRGRLLREGVTVAIAGRPNVGKSTLFNRLAGADRAIVTAIPGTTRDVLTEAVMLGDARITLVDTAGVRATRDPVEREAVSRAEKASAVADLVLVVLDASSPLTDDDRRLLDRTAVRARVIVANKSDLPGAPHEPSSASEELPGGLARQVEQGGAVAISATTGAGIVGLIRAIHTKIGIGDTSECALISNIRQIDLLGHSTEALRRAESTISETLGQTPEELVLVDLRLAVDYLQEVTGKRTTEELLNTIFSNFCIGK